MRLTTVRVPDWPPLAWLAICQRTTGDVRGFIGGRVEVSADSFSEAVWAGSYAEGDFDKTDIVFGSGGRIRDGMFVFVSAASTVDRLYALDRNDNVWVSNSLPCLLANAGASLAVDCETYEGIFNSIIDGLHKYRKSVPTTAGPVRVVYFDNLAWDGYNLVSVPKPAESRDFDSYESYRAFLDSTMASLAANAGAIERKHPYTLLSTLSSGYDSSTVTTLALGAGCKEAIGFDRARGGADDSGRQTAECLGVRFHEVETSAWRATPYALVPFLATATSGASSVVFQGAEAQLAGRVVLTGFHGDKVWDKKTKHLGSDLVRGDTSGTDLTEFRLLAGFIHCPVPYWGALQIRDIHAISNSAELEPWDVPRRYSRPICRRIVEERGVPREAFGVRKAAAAQPTLRPWDFLTPESRRDYLAWLRARRWEWIRRGRMPPMPAADALLVRAARLGQKVERLRLKPWVRKLDPYASRLLGVFHIEILRPRRIHRFVFHWAIERQKAKYPPPPEPVAIRRRTVVSC
jgi:hypothetical protein